MSDQVTPTLTVSPQAITFVPRVCEDVTITCANPSDSHILFKVKTTAPQRYIVKPRQGVIPPTTTETIVISLQKNVTACTTDQFQMEYRVATSKEQSAQEKDVSDILKSGGPTQKRVINAVVMMSTPGPEAQPQQQVAARPRWAEEQKESELERVSKLVDQHRQGLEEQTAALAALEAERTQLAKENASQKEAQVAAYGARRTLKASSGLELRTVIILLAAIFAFVFFARH